MSVAEKRQGGQRPLFDLLLHQGGLVRHEMLQGSSYLNPIVSQKGQLCQARPAKKRPHRWGLQTPLYKAL